MFAMPSLLDARLLLAWDVGRFDEGVRRELDDRTRKGDEKKRNVAHGHVYA